jgi:hypothetical protein
MKTILTLFTLLYFTSFGYSQCATDTIPPIARCANIALQLSNTGIATLTPIFINNQSSDNCGIDSMLVNGQASLSFTCADIGINLVTLYVVDAFGNSSTCVSNVTVIDTIAPTVTCYNTTMQLSNTGITTIVPISISNSSDNCFISSTLVNGQASHTFTCADIGINSVVLSVTDASGNTSSCVSNVTVMDTIAPIASCNNTALYLSNNGIVTLTPTQINNGSSNSCGITTMLVNGLPSQTFNCANLGVNSVVLSVTDTSGNTSSCVSNVTVMDTIAPIASCMNITLPLSSTGIAWVTANQINNNSFDDCGISSYHINGQDSIIFTCTNAGLTTPALLTVIDSSGNSSSCLANITIVDTVAPIAICQDLTIQLSNTGIATVSANQINNGSFDNCGISSILISSDTFDCSNVGANYVVLSVTDFSGNIDSCSSIVTITDSLSYCALSNSTISLIEESIHIYPNPAAQILNISSKESLLEQITLTSITGQVVLTQNEAGSQNTAQLDLSNLPNAVYLITVITNKGISTQKIIVQH